MSDTTWVFGYGSLVSPSSVASTIGRPVAHPGGFAPARLDGFGRRWNYGSPRQHGNWEGPHGAVTRGTVVFLGIEASAGERCNGAVVEVDDAELALLDDRERDYDAVDVTDAVTVDAHSFGGRIVTFVPRRSAIERYLAARADLCAAVRASYVTLVEGAFRALGAGYLDEYLATTPSPDVPVLDVT